MSQADREFIFETLRYHLIPTDLIKELETYMETYIEGVRKEVRKECADKYRKAITYEEWLLDFDSTVLDIQTTPPEVEK